MDSAHYWDRRVMSYGEWKCRLSVKGRHLGICHLDVALGVWVKLSGPGALGHSIFTVLEIRELIELCPKAQIFWVLFFWGGSSCNALVFPRPPGWSMWLSICRSLSIGHVESWGKSLKLHVTMILRSILLHIFVVLNNHFMGKCERLWYQASESAVQSYVPGLNILHLWHRM